jgi:hypothetical protein
MRVFPSPLVKKNPSPLLINFTSTQKHKVGHEKCHENIVGLRRNGTVVGDGDGVLPKPRASSTESSAYTVVAPNLIFSCHTRKGFLGC